MNEFLQVLSSLWNSMSEEEKGSWATLAFRKKTTWYAEFTRWNVRLLMDELEPVKTPF